MCKLYNFGSIITYDNNRNKIRIVESRYDTVDAISLKSNNGVFFQVINEKNRFLTKFN